MADGLPFKSTFLNASSSGSNSAVASSTGRTRVLNYVLSADTSNQVEFRSAATPLTSRKYLAAGGGAAGDAPEHGWLFQTATGEPLNLWLNVAGSIGCDIVYTEPST